MRRQSVTERIAALREQIHKMGDIIISAQEAQAELRKELKGLEKALSANNEATAEPARRKAR